MTSKAQGLPTRFMLIAVVVLVVGSITLSSLLFLRAQLDREAQEQFSADLSHSVAAFQSLQRDRLSALHKENALLADLPSLKALMTTRDTRTIADGAVRFWQVSDNDLFALADIDGDVQALYTRGSASGSLLQAGVQTVLNDENKSLVVAGDRLFACSVQPLYFGPRTTGTVLGYVVTGFAVDEALLRRLAQTASAEIAFLGPDSVVTSTLPAKTADGLSRATGALTQGSGAPIRLDGKRYLASAMDLSAASTQPLHLVVMKSFAREEQARHQLNRLLAAIGTAALLVGTLLMMLVSGWITAPLEELTRKVRSYQPSGDPLTLRNHGTREVRELSSAFRSMSSQILEKNRALLESERLATIGRMASSVSHDFRHYLAAVYANAELLYTSKLSDGERSELFDEIRAAVLGTTDLIESLLIFSRTNSPAARSRVSLPGLLGGTLTLVRAHPDSANVQITVHPCAAHELFLELEPKQMERAIFNLLLNACQAARGTVQPMVTAEIHTTVDWVELLIRDNGPGVSEGIRDSLFEPFVSEGKQKGTGLGLTMAHAVAQEHGGSVKLQSSRAGETVFSLSLPHVVHGTSLPEEQPLEAE